MRKWFRNIFYSFPVQLVVLHFRNGLVLIGTWILLALLVTGEVGGLFGIKYLFRSPEYLGEVNFWSFFFVGFAFAGFTMTWNLTTYLLHAHRFPFLASLSRPFTKYCLNNFIVPLVFVVIYIFCYVYFESKENLNSLEWMLQNIVGLIFGMATLTMLLLIYFIYTNKDILSYERKFKNRPPNLIRTLAPGRPIEQLDDIKTGRREWRVDVYLTESFRPRRVRSVSHYERSALLAVFKQNHSNALLIQLISLLILVVLGMLIENPYFRIPAGASTFFLGSIIVAISGAIMYWFHRWSFLVFLLLFGLVNFTVKKGVFNYYNKAYGLQYDGERPTYSYEKLTTTFTPEKLLKSKEQSLAILENWKAKQIKEKPKMVIFCVSGGGLKAASWAMQVLQTADSLSQGQFMHQTALMSGASGGVLGAAYYRELFLRKQQDYNMELYDNRYIENISKDLLNSIIFTIITNDLFIPWSKFEVNEQIYKKDRGYIFEKQLNENTGYVLDKPLAAYKMPEASAEIPLLFVTPSIVNDGRRLIISAQDASYLTMPPIGMRNPEAVEIDAVDFRTFFGEQQADDLSFTSALRMNATYPYVLPNVFLPSNPPLEIMDAGFRDNFGLKSATRFVHVFKDWIKENTDGVVIVLARSYDRKSRKIESDEERGIIESLLHPIGIAGRILTLQDYENDNSLGFLYDILGEDMFQVIRFTYRPSADNERASMTLHLTDREKRDVLNAIHLPQNQSSMQKLQQVLQPQAARPVGN